MAIKNEDYISKFKQFLYDKSLEYDLYMDRLDNPPFKDIIDFCDGDPFKLVDYDMVSDDDRFRDRKKFMEVIELFVDMSLADGDLNLNGKSRETLISSYINPLEVYKSMMLYCNEYDIKIDYIDQGLVLKKQVEKFYNDLNNKYLKSKRHFKTEYELLELKSIGEEAQKINSLLSDDGSLLEPFEDYESFFSLLQESNLSIDEQEMLLGKVLLSSVEVFEILEPEKPIEVMDYLTSNQIDMVNYAKEIYELNKEDYELLNGSDELNSYVNLYRDLMRSSQEIVDSYFGTYTKDYIYKLMCLKDIDTSLNDFIHSVKKEVKDPDIKEYKDLCFSQLIESVSMFNEIQKAKEEASSLEVEMLDVDLFDVIYLLDKKGTPYIETELTSTYNNKEYHNKISNMVSRVRNVQMVNNSVDNYNKWPIFIMNKGELALSYMNLGNNVRMVITVGDFAGNDDIYSKTNSIVNRDPEQINTLISQANDALKRDYLIEENREYAKNVSELLSGSGAKRKRG